MPQGQFLTLFTAAVSAVFDLLAYFGVVGAAEKGPLMAACTALVGLGVYLFAQMRHQVALANQRAITGR